MPFSRSSSRKTPRPEPRSRTRLRPVKRSRKASDWRRMTGSPPPKRAWKYTEWRFAALMRSRHSFQSRSSRSRRAQERVDVGPEDALLALLADTLPHLGHEGVEIDRIVLQRSAKSMKRTLILRSGQNGWRFTGTPSDAGGARRRLRATGRSRGTAGPSGDSRSSGPADR